MRELLERLCELYNAALQERRDAYRRTGKSPSCYAQQYSLAELKVVRPEYASIYSHLLQDVLHRLERTFRAFFRRCKTGDKPGYPRFKSSKRYRTFTFNEAGSNRGAKLAAGNKRLRLTGIGNVKIKMHRPYEGRIKQVSVTLDGDGHWYALFSCDGVPARPLSFVGDSAGMDVGIVTFAALSDGDKIQNPRCMETAQRSVSKAQRKVSRRKRGSRRRHKAVLLLRRQHARVANRRKDFHYKTALEMVRRYDWIAVEDLNIKGLARGMLARSINDAGWGQFISILASKAESAGREIIKVDPCGTSQICSECGEEVRKDLSVRVHDCPHCGYVVDRDVNAARNIHRRGLRLRGGLDSRTDEPRSLFAAR